MLKKWDKWHIVELFKLNVDELKSKVEHHFVRLFCSILEALNLYNVIEKDIKLQHLETFSASYLEEV